MSLTGNTKIGNIDGIWKFIWMTNCEILPIQNLKFLLANEKKMLIFVNNRAFMKVAVAYVYICFLKAQSQYISTIY